MSSDEQLNIIIRAKDEASKTLKALDGRIKSMEPAFRKMSVVGTAAFAAIGAGVAFATKEAAKAEGSYNKFNTVFGEHSDDMLAFVKDIRKTMPSATHEIVRMSADLQDLLIPMGLTRESAMDMTKGMVELSNKLAAFNDVDPTEVLEAFKSGLSGSSEPLRRFGINALDSSIELEALNTGLLKTGQKLTDLDPILRSQVKAQALLTLATKQSSDAIAGFEENNDSLLRRSQALSASFTEMKATIGTALIPIIDDVVKKIAPLVEQMADWIESHPDLTKNIILAVAALAALVAVVGLLGLALPTIMVGFGLLLGPVGLVLAAIAGLIFTIRQLNEIWKILESDMDLVWAGIKVMFKDGVNFLIDMAEAFANSWVKAVNAVINALNTIQVSIPSWVPKIGGNSFGVNIPNAPEISLPRFEHGGIVNAPAGVPVPIMAHGQERIIPASQAGSGGGDTYIVNLNNPVVRSQDDIRAFKKQVEDSLRDVLRNRKLNTV